MNELKQNVTLVDFSGNDTVQQYEDNHKSPYELK